MPTRPASRSASAEGAAGTLAAERLLLRTLARLHREQPLAGDFRADTVVERALASTARPRPPSHRGSGAPVPDARELHLVLERLSHEARIGRRGRRLFLPGREPRLGAETRARADELLATLRRSGAAPPPVARLAREIGLPEAALGFLRTSGELVTVADGLDYPADVLKELEARVADLIRSEGGVRAARFRDAIGIGRRHAVALLEHFDAIGLTRREGEVRLLQNAAP